MSRRVGRIFIIIVMGKQISEIIIVEASTYIIPVWTSFNVPVIKSSNHHAHVRSWRQNVRSQAPHNSPVLCSFFISNHAPATSNTSAMQSGKYPKKMLSDDYGVGRFHNKVPKGKGQCHDREISLKFSAKLHPTVSFLCTKIQSHRASPNLDDTGFSENTTEGVKPESRTLTTLASHEEASIIFDSVGCSVRDQVG